MMKAKVKTNKVTIELDLFYDKAPITVSNFVNLSNKGYYNDLSFHRVLENFMIQGGCPLGTGTGGPGYQFEDKFHPDISLLCCFINYQFICCFLLYFYQYFFMRRMIKKKYLNLYFTFFYKYYFLYL